MRVVDENSLGNELFTFLSHVKTNVVLGAMKAVDENSLANERRVSNAELVANNQDDQIIPLQEIDGESIEFSEHESCII